MIKEIKSQPLPKVLKEYIFDGKLKNEIEKRQKERRPEVLTLLRSGDFKGITRSVAKIESVNQDVCVPWCKENLTKTQFESLFVRMFDPSKFADLIKQGEIDREDLPDGLINTVEQEKILLK